jgi:hypothetical protein
MPVCWNWKKHKILSLHGIVIIISLSKCPLKLVKSAHEIEFHTTLLGKENPFRTSEPAVQSNHYGEADASTIFRGSLFQSSEVWNVRLWVDSKENSTRLPSAKKEHLKWE